MRGPYLFTTLMIWLSPSVVLAGSAAGEGNHPTIVHRMTVVVFQLAVIIFAARIGNSAVRKLKMPSVLGELLAGMVIGPYLLGSIPLPGFPHGLFRLPPDAHLPVTAEIYSFATIASIILLFFAGLETDLKMFLRFSLAGSLIGIGGVVVTFVIGVLTGHLVWRIPLMDPRALLLGVMSTATSVGITTRILSDRRKMDSPEGVTIMAGAVIDDILGIVLLAVILGYSLSLQEATGTGVAWGAIAMIALKAILVWLGFTVIGLLLAQNISAFLKIFRNERILTIIAFAMALLLAGIFEQAGLAMIIGAYVMGLILSNTDLHYVLQEHLKGLHVFLVPVLFTVMGMLIDIHLLSDPRLLMAGLIYAVGAIAAKLIGCMLPALFLNFNARGALRIGLGMIPRCEVVLIIAGIGLSYGFIDESIFAAAVILIFLSMLTAPPLLNYFLKSTQSATRKPMAPEEKVALTYEYPSEELTEIFANQMLRRFKKAGFFVTTTRFDAVIHRISKERSMISMFQNPTSIVYKAAKEDVPRIKSIVHQSYSAIMSTIDKLEKVEEPE